MPSIDVSANTQSAQAALKQLQDAFKDLQKQGEKFVDIDLSRLGTDQLSRDLKAIVEQWKRMTDPRTGRQFGQDIKNSQQQGKAPWEIDLRLGNANASNADLQRQLEKMVESLLRFTSGNSPELPRPPDRITTPSGSAARDEELRKRREVQDQRTRDAADERARRERDRIAAQEEKESQQRRSQLIGGITGGMKFGLGLAGVQTGMDAIQGGVQGANDINKYTDEFMRRTKDVGNSFDFLRGQITSVGQGLGVATDEAAKLTLAFTRTAHAATIEEAKAGTQAAVGLATGFGADKAQTVQQMAGMSLIGAPGSGPITTRDKKFALILAQAIGQNSVPLEKALGDFSRLAESSAARTTNAPPTESIAGYLKSLYDVSQTHTGLKGNSGLSLLQAADEGLKNNDNPALNMAMFEGLSPIMGTQNYLKILEQKQKGGLAPVMKADGTDSKETNLSVYLKETRKNLGDVDPNALAFYADSQLGLGGMARAKALIKISDQYEGGISGYQKDLAQRNITLDSLNEAGIKDVGDILSAKPKDRFDVAKSKLNTDFAIPLADDERKRLEGLRNQASGGDAAKQQEFIDAMIQTSAKHGMKATPYSTMETELAQIKDVLIQQVGKPITDGFSLVAGFLQKQFGYTPEKIKAEKDYTVAQQASRAVNDKANTAIDAAQAEVDNAPVGSPERAEALRKLEEVQKSWKPATEAVKKNKHEKYNKNRGWWQEFFDKTLGFLTLAQDGDQPLGMNESPEESRNSTDIRTQLKQQQFKHEITGLLWPSEENWKKGQQVDKDLESLDTQQPPPIRRASGGRIPGGIGGGDRVHAALTPGEFVVNAGAAQKNMPLLNQINSGSALTGEDETPATVRDLQKRLEQLFDPVTRYLAELAQGARAMATVRSGNGALAMAGLPGIAGAGATAADGTPITPMTDAARFEAQKGLTAPGKPAGAYPPVTTPSIHNFTGQAFPGDGTGFMSQGTTSARERFEHRSTFVGPLNPDSEAKIRNRFEHSSTFVGPPTPGQEGTPSAKAAREGSAGGWNPHRGVPPSTAKGGAFSKDPQYLAHLQQLEKKHGLPSGLLYGVMMQESRGINKRVSPKGAGGLFQFMPATADRFGLQDRNDPYASAEAAAKYLKTIRNKSYVKNWDEAIAGYNAGEGRIKEYGGIPPFKETQAYVPGVKKWASAAPYSEDHTPVPPPAPDASAETKTAKTAKAAKPKDDTTLPPRQSGDGLGDPSFHLLKRDDDVTPKPKADAPQDTPKPKEPIPEPKMQQASSGQGIGHLDIVMHHQDAYGARIGDDVNHRMNLRTPRPTGKISVASVNTRTA